MADLPIYMGFSRTTIKLKIASGDFPHPVRLSDGGRAVGYFGDQLLKWQEKRKEAARQEKIKAQRAKLEAVS
jgi:predicted DNA-binding transcriptional regulator AlpA